MTVTLDEFTPRAKAFWDDTILNNNIDLKKHH